MVKEMTGESGVEVSVSIFCLENVKYESVDKALDFLKNHEMRHPNFNTPY